MSWDAYVDQLKVVDTVTEAGIFGLDGSLWASTAGLKHVTGEQVKILAGEASIMHACGPKLGDLKCYLLNDERENTENMCLHLRTSPENGKLAVCVGKSNKALVVVIGSGAANKLTDPVFKMIKYLKDVGY